MRKVKILGRSIKEEDLEKFTRSLFLRRIKDRRPKGICIHQRYQRI